MQVDFGAMKSKRRGSYGFSLYCCSVIIYTLSVSKTEFMPLVEFSCSSIR